MTNQATITAIAEAGLAFQPLPERTVYDYALMRQVPCPERRRFNGTTAACAHIIAVAIMAEEAC